LLGYKGLGRKAKHFSAKALVTGEKGAARRNFSRINRLA
jgi:hypothetical protein